MGRYDPLSVRLDFFMPIVPSVARITADGQWHTKKPDCDNMVKFVLDCLNGRAWPDDAQISELYARKLYSKNRPGIKITIRRLEQNNGEEA